MDGNTDFQTFSLSCDYSLRCVNYGKERVGHFRACLSWPVCMGGGAGKQTYTPWYRLFWVTCRGVSMYVDVWWHTCCAAGALLVRSALHDLMTGQPQHHWFAWFWQFSCSQSWTQMVAFLHSLCKLLKYLDEQIVHLGLIVTAAWRQTSTAGS